MGIAADVYVLALVGGTGVGKSSLLNALAGRVVTEAGPRRPTTDRPVAWVATSAAATVAPLLERLGPVDRLPPRRPGPGRCRGARPPGHRLARGGEPGDRGRAAAAGRRRGLGHGPEKYADALLHDELLRRWIPRLDRQVVLVNKADRLGDDGRVEQVRGHLAKVVAARARGVRVLAARDPRRDGRPRHRGRRAVPRLARGGHRREGRVAGRLAASIARRRAERSRRPAASPARAAASRWWTRSSATARWTPPPRRRSGSWTSRAPSARPSPPRGPGRGGAARGRSAGSPRSCTRRAAASGGSPTRPSTSAAGGRAARWPAPRPPSPTRSRRRIAGSPAAIRPTLAAASDPALLERRLGAALDRVVAAQPSLSAPTSRLWWLLGMLQTAITIVLVFAVAWLLAVGDRPPAGRQRPGADHRRRADAVRPAGRDADRRVHPGAPAVAPRRLGGPALGGRARGPAARRDPTAPSRTRRSRSWTGSRPRGAPCGSRPAPPRRAVADRAIARSVALTDRRGYGILTPCGVWQRRPWSGRPVTRSGSSSTTSRARPAGSRASARSCTSRGRPASGPCTASGPAGR